MGEEGDRLIGDQWAGRRRGGDGQVPDACEGGRRAARDGQSKCRPQDGPQVSRLEETCGTVIWAHWRLGACRPGAFLPSHQATVHPFPAAPGEGLLASTPFDFARGVNFVQALAPAPRSAPVGQGAILRWAGTNHRRSPSPAVYCPEREAALRLRRRARLSAAEVEGRGGNSLPPPSTPLGAPASLSVSLSLREAPLWGRGRCLGCVAWGWPWERSLAFKADARVQAGWRRTRVRLRSQMLRGRTPAVLKKKRAQLTGTRHPCYNAPN